MATESKSLPPEVGWKQAEGQAETAWCSISEFTCGLLAQLQEDLLKGLAKLGSENSVQVQGLVKSLFGRYSLEVCSEVRELERLRHLRQELESAIDRREQFLAHILKEAADAIITVDEEQRISIWNRGAETIFGYSEEEMLGREIGELVHPSRLYELEQIQQQTREKGAVSSQLTQWRSKEGKCVQVMLTSTAIRDGEGRYLGCALVVKDVTRQREFEETVRRAEHFASIGRLAAGLAHEIKNPLAGIQGAIEVLRDRNRDSWEDDILARVLREVNRIDKIVKDLLAYAKPKTAQCRPLYLLPVVDRLIKLLKGSGGRRVQFELRGEEVARTVAVLGDENLLEQVFMNLLLNAVEAMEGEGTVRLIFSREAESMLVRVEDTGPGIPVGLQKKIFDPFFTTKQGGTGLGLANCQRILHEHGGSLSLDPDHLQGAAFLLRLPLGEDDAG